MTFKEISTWILLILFAALGYAYASPIFKTWSFEAAGGEQILGFVIAFVVLFAAAHIVLALIAPKAANQAEDERDRRIELYAERAGSFVLGSIVLLGLAVGLITDNRLFTNIMFLGLVASEIVKAGWQVILYRRGA